MPVARLLRNMASVLSSKSGQERHYAMSFPVDTIDTFLSHTWSTPRWKKLLVLVFHFNKFRAMAISFGIAACLSALTAQGHLPSVTVVDKGLEFTRGILCLPLGFLSFFVALFSVHELDSVFGAVGLRQNTIFLDKTCVHQTDMALKQKSIESLAAFLNHSNEMLVLYSDQYMRRLWTVYEVSSWLLLHRGENISLRPLSAAILVLSGLFFLSLNHALWLTFSYTNAKTHLPPALEMTFSAAVTFAIFTIAAWLAAKWQSERERLLGHIEQFRLSNAECTNEEDRHVVQQNIVAFMKLTELAGPTWRDEEVFEAFETLLRKEVPKLMWNAFTRAGMPYGWAVVMGFPNMLAAADLAAGWVLDEKSPRYLALWSVMSVASMMAVAPLMVAMVFALTHFRFLRNVGGWVAIGVLSLGVITLVNTLLNLLSTWAEDSDGWLAAVIFVYLGMGLATAVIYRPI